MNYGQLGQQIRQGTGGELKNALMDNSGPIPRPESPLSNELNALVNSVCELEQQLQQLHARLRPVCLSIPNAASTKDSPGNTPSQGSPVVDALATTNERISQLIRHIGVIQSELAV